MYRSSRNALMSNLYIQGVLGSNPDGAAPFMFQIYLRGQAVTHLRDLIG